MKTIYNEYGFDDIYIVPLQEVSQVKSRKNVDTSITLYSAPRQDFIRFDMPIMLAPMSFFSTHAIEKINNRFIGFLPRIAACNRFISGGISKDWSKIDVRIREARLLYEKGFNFGAAVSIREDIDKIHELSKYVLAILVDTASGYNEDLHLFVKSLTESFGSDCPNIISGNVVSSQGYIPLVDAGSDFVRIGIGSGSNCITSDVSSIGRPPLSAIMEINDTTLYYNSGNNNIICDGGVRNSHDLSIALLFSQFVMSSGMFKYTELNDHWDYAKFSSIKIPSYGMASAYAKKTNDFVEGELTFGDSVNFEELYIQLKQGLQSAMSYLNCHTLEEYKKAKYNLVHSHNYV